MQNNQWRLKIGTMLLLAFATHITKTALIEII